TSRQAATRSPDRSTEAATSADTLGRSTFPVTRAETPGGADGPDRSTEIPGGADGRISGAGAARAAPADPGPSPAHTAASVISGNRAAPGNGPRRVRMISRSRGSAAAPAARR